MGAAVSILRSCAMAAVWACPGCRCVFASLLVASAVLGPEQLSLVFTFSSLSCLLEFESGTLVFVGY